MIGACLCPETDVGLESIPSEPLKCGCCGEPLEITCAGKCGPSHVHAAFAAAVTPTLGYVTSGEKAAIEAPTPSKAVARPLGAWVCVRCTGPIPKKLGRSPLYCEPCLTPAERSALLAKAEKNAAAKAKRMESAK